MEMEGSNDQPKSIMMGQNTAADQHAVQKEESGAIDTRPKLSPYGSPLLALHFGDGPPLFVHAQLIDNIPKLSSFRGGKIVHLGHLPSGTGHVIVHYLFTGTYESLGPRASSGFKKDTAEFATSARVYGFARDYEMPGLEALARGEMEKLGSRLPVMDVLDTLNSITPRLNTNDDWFQGYLKSLIQPLIDNPSASLDSLSNSTDRTMSITNTLLKVVVELWSEKLSSGRCSSDVSQGRHGKSTTPQVHAEAGSAINHEHNPTNVLKYAPSHETHGLPIKKKKAKKTRTEAGDRIGLFWGVDAAADMSRFKDEEATKAQDIICDWTSVASTATTNLSKRALKRLSKAQQNHDSAAANNHNPEPISRPLNVIGCTIDPRLL